MYDTTRYKYKHVAVAINSEVYGINFIKEKYSIHAEHHLLTKLNRIKIKRIDMLVVRFNNENTEIKNSKPCIHCINKMITSKINIRYIYFSDENGMIVRKTLAQLYYDDDRYTSYGNRRRTP